jgi:hypothetical protein
LIVVAVVAGGVPHVDAISSARLDSARRGAQWILDNLEADGSFPQIGNAAVDTSDAIAAVVAGGLSGAPLAPMIAFLQANGPAEATRGAYTGRMIAGIVAAGANPSSFGGFDYTATLVSQYDTGSGAFDPANAFANVQAANGALAANGTLPPLAVTYILSHECPGPEFGFGFGNACSFGPDVDTTALTVNALVAAGLSSDAAVARARSYLFSKENPADGLFFGCCGTSTTSTGLALAMINALGEDPQAPPWRQSATADPVQALLANQDPAGGFSEPGCGVCTNFATVNIIPGMSGRSYPIRPAATGPPPAGEPTPDPEPEPEPEPVAGDRTAPNTTIGPRDLVRTRDRTPTFQFAADEVAVRFECSLDGDVGVPCSSPFTVVRLGIGDHTFYVRAIDAAGNADPTPAADAFKVVKKRRR